MRSDLRFALTIAFLVVAFGASACANSQVVAQGERTTADSTVTTTPAVKPAVVENPTSVETSMPDPATSPGSEPTPLPEPTPEAASTSPVVTPTVLAAPSPTPAPDGPCGAGPLAAPNPDRPRYEADVVINPVAGTVSGSVRVDFTPDLDVAELVLRLWPNGPRPAAGGVQMTLARTMVEGEPRDVVMESPTLALIGLATPLRAGQTVTLTSSFELAVPVELKSRLSGRDDYMRLGTFLPILPWEPGVGWATDPATSLFAEAVSSPVADYRVAIEVPEGFDVLASGVDNGTGVWEVEAARDFAVSVGRFRTVTGVAHAPNPVVVTVGVHDTLGDDPNAYLAKVVDSLESFSQRWGQYPWPSLTFALTPNLSGGIEFPTHIMQGPNTIGRTTSHEVGHMFFYSLVGNNQGTAPWLDEGITSYAEFTYEGVGAGAYEIPSGGTGQATQPMTFWETRADIYYRSVYGQTGFALLQLGSREDVDCALARYVAANAHRIATAEDFVAAFEPTFPDVVNQLSQFGVALDEAE